MNINLILSQTLNALALIHLLVLGFEYCGCGLDLGAIVLIHSLH